MKEYYSSHKYICITVHKVWVLKKPYYMNLKIVRCVLCVSTSKEKLNKLCHHTYDIKCPKKILLIIHTLLSISYRKKGHLLIYQC